MMMNKFSPPPPPPPLLVSQISRQLLCPSGPRVLLGDRCPFIKQEETMTVVVVESLPSELVKKEDGRPTSNTLPHCCSLCTGNEDLFHLAFFSSGPNRDHYLRSLLAEERGGSDLIFCTVCRAAVRRLFNLREEVEDLEAKIRTVVKLGKVGGLLESTSSSSDEETIEIKQTSWLQDDDDDFEVQAESKKFFVKDEPSSSSDDDNEGKRDVKLEPSSSTARLLGSSLDFGHHRRRGGGTKKPFCRSHECRPCGKVFISQRELSKHTRMTHQHHDSKGGDRSGRREENKKITIPELGGNVHGCPQCGSTFSSKSNAINHLLKIHGQRVSLQKSCPICSKVFMTDDLLEAHSHPDPKDPRKEVNTCSLCKKSYKTVSRLRGHRLKMHKVRFRGVCHHCGKVFHTQDCLKGHIQTCLLGNKEDQRSCPCGKVFRSGAERLEHEMVVHEGKTSKRCYFCSKVFLNFGNLSVHLRAHTNERPFLCPKCRKKFSSGSSCRRHMRRVCGLKGKGSGMIRIEGSVAPRVRARRRDPRYECPSSCGQVFKQKLLLRAHIKEVHPEQTVDVNMDSKPDIPCFKDEGGRKFFGCPECGNRFVHKKSVFIHMVGVHGVKVARRKFCPICSKAFRSLEVFQAHTHPDKGDPGKVVYNCALCTKSLKTVADLTSHRRRLHCGGMKCYFCAKPLSKFQSKVAAHLRTHTLERPYVCDKCGKEFGSHGNFKEHKMTDCWSNKEKVEEVRMRRREREGRMRAKLLHPCGDCERRFPTRRELSRHNCVNKE